MNEKVSKEILDSSVGALVEIGQTLDDIFYRMYLRYRNLEGLPVALNEEELKAVFPSFCAIHGTDLFNGRTAYTDLVIQRLACTIVNLACNLLGGASQLLDECGLASDSEKVRRIEKELSDIGWNRLLDSDIRNRGNHE